MENSGAETLMATERFAQRAREVVQGSGIELVIRPASVQSGRDARDGLETELEALETVRGGLMLYTSGTTSRPKGVFLPHAALTAQASSLIQAWKYAPQDRLLHLLPLHHIHGTVNALLTPLMAGSSIEFLFPFNADAVWRRLASPFLPTSHGTHADETEKEKITFLTAVPTIYTKLLHTFATLPGDVQAAAQTAIAPATLRLNISGSAALPTPTKQAWQTLSNGNVLLERYGMTEVGMAISGGLDFADRVDGSVGWPLPSVQARLVDPDSNEVISSSDPSQGSEHARPRVGEIHLRGPCVFAEYWGNPKATDEAFVTDDSGNKWFRTGDMATTRPVSSAGSGASGDWAQGPLYFIHGRQSVDIIKTAGEKVSALEVERELLSLYVSVPVLVPVPCPCPGLRNRPQISEAAVLALPSPSWGQKVAAVVVLTRKMTALDIRKALKHRLAPYKIPVEIRVVDEIPRNAMGKGEFFFFFFSCFSDRC